MVRMTVLETRTQALAIYEWSPWLTRTFTCDGVQDRRQVHVDVVISLLPWQKCVRLRVLLPQPRCQTLDSHRCALMGTESDRCCSTREEAAQAAYVDHRGRKPIIKLLYTGQDGFVGGTWRSGPISQQGWARTR